MALADLPTSDSGVTVHSKNKLYKSFEDLTHEIDTHWKKSDKKNKVDEDGYLNIPTTNRHWLQILRAS